MLKTNDWPTSKRDLIKKHIKEFMKFTNAMTLDEINAEQNSQFITHTPIKRTANIERSKEMQRS